MKKMDENATIYLMDEIVTYSRYIMFLPSCKGSNLQYLANALIPNNLEVPSNHLSTSTTLQARYMLNMSTVINKCQGTIKMDLLILYIYVQKTYSNLPILTVVSQSSYFYQRQTTMFLVHL